MISSSWLSISGTSDPDKDKLAIRFALRKFALENMVGLRFGRRLSALLTPKNCFMKRDKLVMMVTRSRGLVGECD